MDHHRPELVVQPDDELADSHVGDKIGVMEAPHHAVGTIRLDGDVRPVMHDHEQLQIFVSLETVGAYPEAGSLEGVLNHRPQVDVGRYGVTFGDLYALVVDGEGTRGGVHGVRARLVQDEAVAVAVKIRGYREESKREVYTGISEPVEMETVVGLKRICRGYLRGTVGIACEGFLQFDVAHRGIHLALGQCQAHRDARLPAG